MHYTPSELASALTTARTTDRVRLAADWLATGDVDDQEPAHTGQPAIDALVAAVVAHKCRQQGVTAPQWVHDGDRCLGSFWHPGDDAFFAISLAHTPAEFLVRGVVIASDSLESV